MKRRARLQRIVFAIAMLATPAFPHESAEEQIADLTARLGLQPGDPWLRLKRGDQYRFRGDWRKARNDYRRARRIDPALDVVDLRLGALDLDRGRLRSAKTALDRYLARRPYAIEGLRTRSKVLSRLGMPLVAAEDLRRAIAAFTPPRRPEPDDYLDRARAFEDAGPDYIDAAILALDEGMAALGPIVSLQFPAIELELRAGRVEKALRRLDVLEAASGRRDGWHAKRAAILGRSSGEGRQP